VANATTYRKNLYRKKTLTWNPWRTTLRALPLDLLMSEEGFHRASGNPLLWQNAET